MNRKHAIGIVLLMLVVPLFALAQDADKESEGRVWGDYKVHQSFEFGGHIVDTTGSDQMYSTYVNLKSGPRLLGQDLSMQSISHQGLLFDNLYVSSFGFGGDPENLGRLRISKNKWYNFVGLYRRDENFFDYNLFANPLQLNQGANIYVPFINTTTYTGGDGTSTINTNFNPQTMPWFTNSPHLQNTTRNMGDFSLTLLPQSAVSFRLGYARNATHGRIDSTTSSNPLTERTEWRSDRYQAGVDVKLLPRTTISADFFFEHDKNDLNYQDNNLLFTLAGTTIPVDIGMTFFPAYQTSGTSGLCTPEPAITSPGVFVLSPTCTGALLDYRKRGNVRTDIPTGQLSFVSNYFRKLDITASGIYSSADSDFRNFNEFSYGLSPSLANGPVNNGRTTTNADLGLTYHLSRSWSVSDNFRWVNWRESGAFDQAQFNCIHATGQTLLDPFRTPCDPSVFGSIQATNPGATIDPGLFAAASTNFAVLTSYRTLLAERSYYNTFKLHWQPSRLFRAYVGYRYGRRELKAGDLGQNRLSQVTATFANTGTGAIPTTPTCTITTTGCDPATGIVTLEGEPEVEKINLHTALFGVVVRPVEAWRINADAEFLSADNTFTAITPRHQQRVRAYTTFKVKRWASINGGVHFVETRNPFAQGELVEGTATLLFPSSFIPAAYGHKDHWRSYSAGVSLNPNSKFSFDIGWTLLDQDIKSATCMPIPTDAFAFTNPITLGSPTTLNCANSPAITGTTSWSTAFARPLLLNYQEETNTLYVNASYRPVKRVTLLLSVEVTGDNGRTTWLRGDNGQPLLVVGDVFGNVPYIAANLVGGSNAGSLGCPAGVPTVAVPLASGTGTGCLYSGPFPDQPLGPQAINWYKTSAGIAVNVTPQITFKGIWGYYDYNAKDGTPALSQLSVVAPRDFHAHVGTVSLRYSF